eukprot:317999_1
MEPPRSINELISRLKSVGITDDHLNQFQDAMNENGFGIEEIKEDINEQQDSQLFEICRDDLRAKVIYDIVKVIMDGSSVTKALIIDYSLQNTAYLLEKCDINDYYDDIAKLENNVDPKDYKLFTLDMQDGYASHEDTPANQYIAQWKHIGNAMKHELYEEISKTFMEIINDKTKYKTDVGGDILFTLRNKAKIDTNEIKYIEQLIKRTMMFFHPFKSNNISQQYAVKSDQNPLFAEDNEVMNGLNMSTLCDIYNVHNCFLFMNFNFQQYDTAEFAVGINKSMEQTNKCQINIQEIEHMKFNLFSSYIIDDDMFSICNYFIATSHLVNKIRQ